MINGTKIIALCTARVNDDATCELVNELNKRLVSENCRLLVFHMCSDFFWKDDYMQTDSAVFELIDYRIVDIVILMDEKIKNKEIGLRIIKQARSNKIPVITVDCNPDYKDVINVRFDFEKGFEDVVRHMIEDHGVRDVHFMGGPKGNSFSEARLKAFRKVLKENNIRFTESMVSYGEFWEEPTKVAMQKLLAKGNVPEAIICANDVMAINVCKVLKEYGYQVPQQVKVTGFDGIDEIYFLKPNITSSICNYRHMAIKIHEVITDCFIGRPITKDNYIVPRMLIAESCGCNNHRQKPDDSNYVGIVNMRFHRYQDDSKNLGYMAEKIQICDSMEEIAGLFDNEQLEHVSIWLNKCCEDDSINPTDMVEYLAYDDALLVLKDCGKENTVVREVKLDHIYQELEQLFERRVPIIINALYAWNKVLGVVCFAYEDINITNYGEIPLVVNALNQGIGGYMNCKYQKYLRRNLEEMYRYDSLTGLFNRMGFTAELSKHEKYLQSQGNQVTVVLSDLDDLKKINDNYGHMAGDKAIMMTASALKASCPPNAICMRLGGDEMVAVILGECDTKKIKKEIQKYMDVYNKSSGLPYRIENSIGIYQIKDMEKLDLDELLMHADKAMYEEKNEHRKTKKNG